MEHTEEHFAYENRLMKQYAFPATAEHKGEHQRVMNEFKKRGGQRLAVIRKGFCQKALAAMFRTPYRDDGQRPDSPYQIKSKMVPRF